ncbi:MAG: Cro/CI family transcriptional regulator [Candidatus Phlomobacter fragariae]
MKRLSLLEYVNLHGQEATAKALGLYQSGISKEIRMRRKITVLIHDDGRIEAEEIKPFPSNSIKSKSN